jgi:hypothetical protein
MKKFQWAYQSYFHVTLNPSTIRNQKMATELITCVSTGFLTLHATCIIGMWGKGHIAISFKTEHSTELDSDDERSKNIDQIKISLVCQEWKHKKLRKYILHDLVDFWSNL